MTTHMTILNFVNREHFRECQYRYTDKPNLNMVPFMDDNIKIIAVTSVPNQDSHNEYGFSLLITYELPDEDDDCNDDVTVFPTDRCSATMSYDGSIYMCERTRHVYDPDKGDTRYRHIGHVGPSAKRTVW